MKKQGLKALCVLMVLTSFMLSACGKTEKTNSGEAEQEAVQEGTVLGKYSDKIFQKETIDGKMACYFLGSHNAWSTWQNSTHAGDSVLFVAPDGTTMLYDCQTPNNAAYIVYALKQLGITKIDYFVNSHPHIDHIGGFPLLAENFEIGQVYTPAAENAYNGKEAMWYATEMYTTVKEKAIPWSYVVEGDTFNFGKDVKVKVYNPPTDFNYDDIDYNECSVILKLTYGESSFLVGGDTGDDAEAFGRATETEVVAKYGAELQADVSKMNHHGDSTLSSASEGWLNAVDSKIYVGTMSSITDEIHFFKHVATGANIYHTGIDGTVLVYTTGDGSYDVQIEKERTSNYYGTLKTTEGHMRVE